jgi:hypothetical protein
VGLKHEFSDQLELSLGYLANDPANPREGGGLFNGPYGAIAQLTFQPSERFTIGATYIHAYNTDFTVNGPTGSNRANVFSFLGGIPTSSNAYGLAASFQLTPSLVLNGSVGYTETRTLASAPG